MTQKVWKYLVLFLAGSVFLFVGCSEKENNKKDDNGSIEEISAERFRSNRIFIKHGLQIQCWLATDNFKLAGEAGQPAYVMQPSDWALTGFTGPTFYGPPLVNTSFFKHFPGNQWAIAKAPHGDQIKVGPTDHEKQSGFLSDDQKTYLDKLVTICFGDEEVYSDANLYFLKDWYLTARKHYPDALLHNNQYPGLWSTSNLRKYVKVALPDLITYDRYYFHTSDNDDYIGARDMSQHLKTYRDVALEGWDGNKKEYIAFGQYIQGFVNQGTYKLTESQLRLYYFMTLTFGGKWLNWFRYLQGDGYGGATAPTPWSLLFENGMPGRPSIYMTWANQCNKECLNLGDYLVRLKTSDVRYVAGTSRYSEGQPDNVDVFNPAGSCIKQICGRFFIDGLEADDGADLYLGYFDIIPKEEQGDPSFFKKQNADFFMVTNGMASKLEQEAISLSQMVTLTLDLSDFDNQKLYWINTETGEKEELEAVNRTEEGSTYKFLLKGGTGTLFIVE